VVYTCKEGRSDPRKHEVLQIVLGRIPVIKPIPKYYLPLQLPVFMCRRGC